MFDFYVGQDKDPNEDNQALQNEPLTESAVEYSEEKDNINKTEGDSSLQPAPQGLDSEQISRQSLPVQQSEDENSNSEQKKKKYPDEPEKGSRFAPMSVKNYFWSMFIMNVPLIGWLVTLVWAMGLCKNRNRRNMARAQAIWIFVGLCILVIAYFAIKWFLLPRIDTIIDGPAFRQWLNMIKGM